MRCALRLLFLILPISAAFATGRIVGTISDFNSHQPITGATLRVFNQDTLHRTATSDSLGRFTVTVNTGGPYRLIASEPYHTDSVASNVYVDEGDVVQEYFELRAPIFSIEPTSLNISLAPSDSINETIVITNPGSDTLFWRARYRLGLDRDETDEIWDSLLVINIQQLTGDNRINGVVFLNGVFYAAGSNGASNPNKIYRFDSVGTYLGSFDQPNNSNIIGYRTLATDGVNLFGSAEAGIDVINPITGALVRRFNGPTSPNRLTFDPVERCIWTGDSYSPIYKIDTLGNVIRSYSNNGSIRGMSIHPEDPDGYRLYVTNSVNSGQGRDSSWYYKMNTTTGAIMQMRVMERATSSELAGSAITNRWSPYYWVLLQVWSGANVEQKIVVYEQQVSVPWMQVTPLLGSVPQNRTANVSVRFNASLIDTGNYRAAVLFSGNHSADFNEVPVDLHVGVSNANEPVTTIVPNGYNLSNPYPNPFNPETKLTITLPEASRLQLTLFDLNGREIHREQLSANAGQSTITINGSGFGSGTYFMAVSALSRSGETKWSSTKKLTLIK